MLHDVVEDTKYNHEDIVKEFSEEVANLVDGVTKLGEIEYKTKEERQADNVRKMLIAMAKDIRVILIKLADRLHNMRTLKYMPVEKQKAKAKETLDIYAPIAHRLGMSKIKWELEDLSLRYINPNEYYDLVNKISDKRVEREEYISLITKDLKESLAKSGIKAEIEGRPKHFYSIYRKMASKNKTIDQIFDLTAVRILVDSVRDCYAALGIVHTKYKPIPGRFKDYIAMPKPNMYQSLHSTVIGTQGKPFEIQIRTFEMHKTAEYGIAAHWKYKEGNQSGESNESDLKLTWLREMLDWQNQTSDAQEFMEGFKTDLFSDEIFVFTPKGTVINLPSEATAIDFAYKIHTDIGNRCIGVKVNGKIKPLDYVMNTGDIVEILTSTVARGPKIEWLNMAKGSLAKGKIKAWFKKAKREENIENGKELLERETKKQGYNFGEISKKESLELILKKYNMNSADDLFASVGVGDIVASTVVTRLKEQWLKANKQETLNIKEEEEVLSKSLIKNNENKANKTKMANPDIVVKGVNNILVRFAKCCNPVPGDDIVGYITKGRGVSVHRKDCTNVKNVLIDDDNKIVDVSWGNGKGSEYITLLQITAEDRNGILSEIMELIVSSKTCMIALDAKSLKDGNALINIKLKICDIEQLKDLMRKIKRMQGVIDVFRKKN